MDKNLVVLVDDDPMSNTINTLILKKQNPNTDVVVFYNGYDALKYLCDPSSIKPNVIFLDINMPGMTGWDFIEEFEKKNLSIEIVVVTSSTDIKDRERTMNMKPVKDYFTKPISLDNVQHYFLSRL